MTIEGRVANILNERDLVINRGSDHGVEPGMRFKVNSPEIKIADPVTGDDLGLLVREKIRVKVLEVYPQFAVAKTYETYQDYEPSVLSSMLAATSRTRVTRVRTMTTGTEIQLVTRWSYQAARSTLVTLS